MCNQLLHKPILLKHLWREAVVQGPASGGKKHVEAESLSCTPCSTTRPSAPFLAFLPLLISSSASSCLLSALSSSSLASIWLSRCSCSSISSCRSSNTYDNEEEEREKGDTLLGSHTHPVLFCHPCRERGEGGKAESKKDEHHQEGEEGEEEGEAGGGDIGGDAGDELSACPPSCYILHSSQSPTTFNAGCAHYGLRTVFRRVITHLGLWCLSGRHRKERPMIQRL